MSLMCNCSNFLEEHGYLFWCRGYVFSRTWLFCLLSLMCNYNTFLEEQGYLFWCRGYVFSRTWLFCLLSLMCNCNSFLEEQGYVFWCRGYVFWRTWLFWINTILDYLYGSFVSVLKMVHFGLLIWFIWITNMVHYKSIIQDKQNKIHYSNFSSI